MEGWKVKKPYNGKTSAFICTLPTDVQKQIEKDLRKYAEKEELEIDIEEAMSGRFCDIEEIYH